MDCRALSPETETNYTLISARYGWRLSKRRDARGKLIMEWRCPKCWRAYKGGGGDGVAASPSGEMAAFESPSGTRSVVPPAADDDIPTLVDKSKRRSRSTVPPPSRRGRAR